MAIGAVAGTKLFIADPGTPVLSDFVEVGNTSNLGDIQRAFAAIAVEEVGNPTTYSLKGTENFPNVTLEMNRNNDDAGQLALMAASADREVLYNFRFEEPDGGVGEEGDFTVTIAGPGVFTKTAHGLAVGDRVTFTTTGALPTGLVEGTTYYVVLVPTADTWQVSTTFGGTPLTTTGSQSGTHSFESHPVGTTTDWKGEVFGFGTTYGGPNVLRKARTEISIRPETFVYTPVAA